MENILNPGVRAGITDLTNFNTLFFIPSLVNRKKCFREWLLYFSLMEIDYIILVYPFEKSRQNLVLIWMATFARISRLNVHFHWKTGSRRDEEEIRENVTGKCVPDASANDLEPSQRNCSRYNLNKERFRPINHPTHVTEYRQHEW